MIEAGGLALLRPLWLVAIPLIVGGALWLVVRGGLGDWRKAVDARLFQALEGRGAVVAGAAGRRFTPSVVAALILVIALAGPAVQRVAATTFRNLDGLLVAVDLSRSMAEGGSLGEARISTMEVVEAAGSRQAGLIVYAGDAYLAATFTSDRPALGQLIASLAPDLVAERGSAPARAILLALDRFAEAGVLAGDLVLVSDGGGVDPTAENAATRLAAAGHRLHVLFVPATMAPDGAPEPDPEAAARLAAVGGGVIAPFTDPARLKTALGEPAALRLARSPYAALGWVDYGRFLLLAAAAPLLMLFRRAA